jgi:predicted unusual protein kinase regulating ubiquinone biosynthesis (AarF/ABC1/UbiB family)
MELELERSKHEACQADLRKFITTVNILHKKLDKEYERNDVLAKGLQRLGRLRLVPETISNLCQDLYEIRRHMRRQQSTSTQSRRTSESRNDFDLEIKCQGAESGNTAPESVDSIESEDTSLF